MSFNVIKAQDAMSLRDALSPWITRAEVAVNADMSDPLYIRAASPTFKSNIDGRPTHNDKLTFLAAMSDAGYIEVSIVEPQNTSEPSMVYYSFPDKGTRSDG